VGNREAVEGDIPAVVGSPGLAVDSQGLVADIPAAEGTPAAVGSQPVEGIRAVEDSPAEADNRVAVGSPAEADNLVAADNPVVAGMPAAAADNSRAAAAPRRKSCRIWHKRCSPGLPAYRN
jgi:hypothetical protein